MKVIEKEKIDELVSTIDRLMIHGTGHVNVSNLETEENMVVHENSATCSVTGACCQPTENLDDN